MTAPFSPADKYPLSGRPPDAELYNRPTLIAAIAASVGVIVGSLAPWAHVVVFSVNGLDAGYMGRVTLTLGVLSGVVLLIELAWARARFNPRWAVPVAWAVAVAGVACLTIALPVLIRLLTSPKESVFGLPVGPEVGWGLWLLTVSSVVLCVTAAIVATQIAKNMEFLQPPGQSTTSWANGWRWVAIMASAVIAIAGTAYFAYNWNDKSLGSGPSPSELPSFPSSGTTPETTEPAAPTASAPPGPATTTPAPLDPESASLTQLKALANADRPFVTSALADRWVPQLSSKRPGLVADGIVWDNATTLREHRQLRQRYPGVRLLWSGDWSTFSSPDFWVTVVGIGSPDSKGALAWCTNQNLDRDHCYAKLITTTHPVAGSTAYN